jgi:valyl-tRNA synthetase
MVGAAALRKADSAPSGLPATVTPLGTFFLDLSAGVDIDAERKRLTKESETLDKIIQGIEAKLGNSSFVDKAPPQVVEGAKKQLAENQSKLKETGEALKALE